jgi:hypothetical protein
VSGKTPHYCFFSQADAVWAGWEEEGGQLAVGRTVLVNARLAPPHLRHRRRGRRKR